jgi:hypothetical protein
VITNRGANDARSPEWHRKNDNLAAKWGCRKIRYLKIKLDDATVKHLTLRLTAARNQPLNLNLPRSPLGMAGLLYSSIEQCASLFWSELTVEIRPSVNY